ncbi:MAG: glycosyltransferase family 4 protein [Acidobacteriaceae bacterium]|nr:glycosyltransferase family 4 protein [Acidobacteriaceae bacterium]
MRDIVDDVRISDLAILRKSNLKNLRLGSVIRLIKRVYRASILMRDYDLVYINTIPVLDYILATRFSHQPAIVHVHELPTGTTSTILSALLRFSGAAVLFNSHATAQSFSLSQDQSREVLWNGLPDYTVPRSTKPKAELNILMIGRFNAWKGQATLIRALASLSIDQRAKIRVRIVGSYFENQRHYYDNIVQLVQENDLSEIAEILPFREDPSDLYAWADIVTVPSEAPEPFGLVAVEAMAASCCVIAANHGGLREIVVDGSTGTLVVPGNADHLATAIATYLENPILAQQHGSAGRDRFLSEFHESRYMERIGNFIGSRISRS